MSLPSKPQTDLLNGQSTNSLTCALHVLSIFTVLHIVQRQNTNSDHTYIHTLSNTDTLNGPLSYYYFQYHSSIQRPAFPHPLKSKSPPSDQIYAPILSSPFTLSHRSKHTSILFLSFYIGANLERERKL